MWRKRREAIDEDLGGSALGSDGGSRLEEDEQSEPQADEDWSPAATRRWLDEHLGPSQDDLYESMPGEGEIKLSLMGSFDFPYIDRTPEEYERFRAIAARVVGEMRSEGLI
jgi:hypothetical protein